MRVLIAEDDPVSRLIIRRALQSLGHEVLEVADGTAADAALNEENGPTVAVLDWEMPGLTGLDVCRAVRRRSGTYRYLILLTGRDRREDRLNALEAGVDEFLTKPLDIVELQSRLRSAERITELQAGLLRTQEALRREASHDPLTGLFNRGMIAQLLSRELVRARSEKRELSVLMIDLDHFKQVNDRFGHLAGDAVLRESARRLASGLRSYDSLGRYGGEEFLAVLPGCSAEIAAAVGERIRNAVSRTPIEVEGKPLDQTVSIGIATTVVGTEAPDALLGDADAALYRAKRGGRNHAVAAIAAVTAPKPVEWLQQRDPGRHPSSPPGVGPGPAWQIP